MNSECVNVDGFSIVIPVYNESETVGNFIQELQLVLGRASFMSEIICVNDCSVDNSLEILERHDGIRIISHMRNKGYGASLKTGILGANYQHIITMDGDGQHDPNYLLDLVEKYRCSYSMVVGARNKVKQDVTRTFGKKFISFLARYLFMSDIMDLNSGYRVFDKKTSVGFFHLCSDRFSFSTSITLSYLSENLDVYYFPVTVRRRQGGESYVNLRSGWQAIWRILSIAMVFNPVRIFLPIAIACFVGSFFSLCVDIYRNDIGDFTVTLILSGIFMIFFSLLSEQISVLRRELGEIRRKGLLDN